MANNIKLQLAEAVRLYRVPPEAASLLAQHKPLLIAGATAAGKGAVADFINQNSEYGHVITHTTRPSRADEENGKDYWFVSDEEMLELLRTNRMVEVKIIHNHATYGVSIKSYRATVDSGRKPLLIIDVQGAEDIAKHVPDLQAVFLLPPSFEVWMERLDKRGHMSHVERSRRLQSARQEIEHALKSRYFNLYVNRDVNSAAQDILRGAVILSEQHHNRELAQQLLDHIRAY